jgi:hypothetical protein
MEEGRMTTFRREQFRVKSEDMQRKIAEFTLSHRFWTAYPADRLEVMLWHFFPHLKGFRYSGFDPNTDEAIFVGEPVLTGEGLPPEYGMLPANDPFLSAPPSKDAMVIDNPPAHRALPKPNDNP